MSGYDLGAMVVLSVFVLLTVYGKMLIELAIEVLRRWNRDKGGMMANSLAARAGGL